MHIKFTKHWASLWHFHTYTLIDIQHILIPSIPLVFPYTPSLSLCPSSFLIVSLLCCLFFLFSPYAGKCDTCLSKSGVLFLTWYLTLSSPIHFSKKSFMAEIILHCEYNLTLIQPKHLSFLPLALMWHNSLVILVVFLWTSSVLLPYIYGRYCCLLDQLTFIILSCWSPRWKEGKTKYSLCQSSLYLWVATRTSSSQCHISRALMGFFAHWIKMKMLQNPFIVFCPPKNESDAWRWGSHLMTMKRCRLVPLTAVFWTFHFMKKLNQAFFRKTLILYKDAAFHQTSHYLLIYLYQHKLKDSCFAKWIIIYYHYFDEIIPDLASGRSQRLVSVSFWHAPVILGALLGLMYFVCSNPRIAFFFQSALISLSGE